MKKKISLSIATIALAGLITGCGSSSSSSSSNSNNNTTSNNQTPTTQNQKSVKAVDGYIIGANVCDTKGVCSATDTNGTATAKFANTALTATGGYIDVNGNNKIDDNDIKLPDTFTLRTPAGESVISPITDLIANGADPKKLAEVLGVNEADLYKDPIATNNVDLAKAIQIVYALKTENKESVLVEKINKFEPVTNTLPNINSDSEYITQEKNNTTSNTGALPNLNKVTALPNLNTDSNYTTTTNSKEVNNSNSNLTANFKGGIDVFANLASSVASGEAKTLITAVMASTATTPVALEQEIAETKKDLIKTEEATAQTVENNATAENTQATETNTTETAENSAQAETNTTAENTQATETNSNSVSNNALPDLNN